MYPIARDYLISWIGLENLKDMLVLVFNETLNDNFALANLVNQDTLIGPQHHVFINNPEIVFPDFDKRHFEPTYENRRKNRVMIPPVVLPGRHPNWLYDLVNKCDVKKHMLTMVKIKSVLKSFLDRDVPLCDDDILDYFRKACYIMKKDDLEINYSKLSWIVPFIPTRMMFYDINNLQSFQQHFMNGIRVLRDRIIDYVRDYLKVHKMPRDEQEAYKKDRIAAFVEIQRSFPVQAMYLQRYPTDYINEYIYQTYFREIKHKTMDKRSKAYSLKLKSKFAKLNANVSKQKELNNDFDQPDYGIHNYVPEPICDKYIKDVDFQFLADYVDAQNKAKVRREKLIATAGSTKRYAPSWTQSIKDYFTDVGIYWWDNCEDFFSGCYRYTVTSCIQFVMKFYYNRRVRETREFVKVCTDDFKHLLSPGYKMSQQCKSALVDIYAIINVIYDITQGSYKGAMRHGGYLGITHFDDIKDSIYNLTKMLCVNKTQPLMTSIHFMYHGREYVLNHQQWAELQTLQNNGQNVAMFFATVAAESNDVIASAGENNLLSSTIAHLASFCQSMGHENMTDQELRRAISLSQILHYDQKRTQANVDLMLGASSIFMRTVFGFDPMSTTFQSVVNEIMDINDFTVDMIAVNDEICRRVELMRLVKLKYEIATEIRDSYHMVNIPRWIEEPFKVRYAQLERMYRTALASEKTTHIRVPPCVILFVGPEGTGKTTGINAFYQISAYCDGLIYDDSMTYVKNSGNEYYEGYNKHRYVQNDEFCWSNDPKEKALDAGFILNAATTVAFNLNMAFDRKGACYFDSEYVLLSSNLTPGGWRPYKPKRRLDEKNELGIAITSTDALERRFDLVLFRDEPGSEDAVDNLYRIDQCTMFPELQGQWKYLPDIARIAHKIKVKQRERSKKMQMSLERLAQLMPEFAYLHTGEPVLSETSSDHAESITHSELSEPDDFNLAAAPDVIEDYVEPTAGKHQTFAERADEMETHQILKKLANKPIDNITYIGRIAKLFFKYEDKTPLERKVLEEKIRNYIFYAFLAIGAVTFGALSYLFVKYMTPYNDPMANESPQVVATSPEKTRNRRGVRARKAMKRAQAAHNRARMVTPGIKSTSGIPEDIPDEVFDEVVESTSGDKNYMDCLHNRIAKGVARIQIAAIEEDGVRRGEPCVAFHIKDGWFLSTAHLFYRYYMAKDPKISLTWDGQDRGPVIKRLPQFIQFGEEDICAFKIDGCNLPPALYSFFATEQNFRPIISGTPMRLVVKDDFGATNIRMLTKAEDINCEEYVDCGTSFTFEYPMFYFAHITPGDSGSPVCIKGDQGRPMIVGLQCAKNQKSTFGIATPIFKEGIDEYLSPFGFVGTETIESTGYNFKMPMEILEFVDMKDANFPPNKTRLEESDLFEWHHPAKFLPAKLAPFKNDEGEVVDPLVKAMGKLNQVEKYFDPVDDYIIELAHQVYPSPDETFILTLQQALEGITEKDINSICLSTGVGYPKCLNRKKGKSPYVSFNSVTNKHEYSAEFLQEMMELLAKLKCGEQIDVIWQDLLKDETRPVEKIKLGKTRLFSACPLHYLILMRMYFGDFVAYIQSFHGVKPVSVGINPHSIEWTRLYKILESRKGSVIAGDFENYDGTIPIVLLEAFLKFVNEWYHDSEENQNIRKLLMHHVMYAKHIIFDTIFQTIGSLPSGFPLTAPCNSIINFFIMTTVAIYDLGMKFKDFVQFNYGDDNLMTTSFCNIKVSDFTPHILRRFGMKYTHCSKTDSDISDTLETITFLGRKFRFDNGIYRAPLDLDTIIESTYWCRKGSDHDTVVLSTAETFFLELSHHPREVFDTLSAEYLKAVKQRTPHLYKWVQSSKQAYTTYRREFYESGNILVPTSGHVRPFESNQFADNVRSSDRANVNLPDGVVHELGVDQVVNQVTVSNPQNAGLQGPQHSSTVETFKQDNIFERFELIAQESWTTAQATDTTISNYNFPTSLFSVPYIANKLAYWRYFRAELEVEVNVVSMMQLCGLLMIAFIPFERYYTQFATTSGSDSAYGGSTTVYALSGGEHRLVSATSSETVRMRVPFVSPYTWLDLSKFAIAEMGHVIIKVLAPLTDSDGAAQTVTVVVRARFVNAEVCYPIEATSGRSRESDMKAFLTGAAEVVRDELATFVAGSVLRVGSMAARMMFKADKPMITNTGQLVQNHNNYHIGHANGIQNAPTLGFDAENKISTKADRAGIVRDEMSIAGYVGTPAISSIFSITSTLNVVNLAALYDIESTHMVYLDIMRTLHHMYSGSILLKLYFSAHMFQNVTVVLYWATSSSANPFNCYNKVVEIRGMCEVEMSYSYPYQRMATTVSATNPTMKLYCKTLAWSQQSTTASTPVTCVVYKAGGPDSRFYLLKDMKFTVTSGNKKEILMATSGTKTTGNPRADFARGFEPFHGSMTTFEHGGLICGEETTHLNDILHRYYPKQIFPTGTGIAYIDSMDVSAGSGTVYHNAAEILVHSFRFFSGSTGLKVQAQSTATSFVAFSLEPTTSAVGDVGGTAALSIGAFMSDTGEVMMPFYKPVLFDNTSSNLIYPLSYQCTTNVDNAYLFKTYGDDFKLYWMTLPVGTFAVDGNTGAYLTWIYQNA